MNNNQNLKIQIIPNISLNTFHPFIQIIIAIIIYTLLLNYLQTEFNTTWLNAMILFTSQFLCKCLWSSKYLRLRSSYLEMSANSHLFFFVDCNRIAFTKVLVLHTGDKITILEAKHLIDTKTTSLNHHRGRHRIVRGALSLGAFRYDFCCYFSQVACERLDYGYVVLSDRHTSATLHSLTYPDRKRETERQLVRALRASTFQCIFPIRL